jgi:hypothetical protein
MIYRSFEGVQTTLKETNTKYSNTIIAGIKKSIQ